MKYFYILYGYTVFPLGTNLAFSVRKTDENSREGERLGKRNNETLYKNLWRMTMELIQSIADRFIELLMWGWKYGGWWFAGGALSCLFFIGMGIHRAPYR
jgi:hypothetical protein